MENKKSIYMPSNYIAKIEVLPKKMLGYITKGYTPAKTFLGFTYARPKEYYAWHYENGRECNRYRKLDKLLENHYFWHSPIDKVLFVENGQYTVFDEEEWKLYSKPTVKVIFADGIVLFNTFKTDNEAVAYAEKLNTSAKLTSFDYTDYGHT